MTGVVAMASRIRDAEKPLTSLASPGWHPAPHTTQRSCRSRVCAYSSRVRVTAMTHERSADAALPGVPNRADLSCTCKRMLTDLRYLSPVMSDVHQLPKAGHLIVGPESSHQMRVDSQGRSP